MNSYEIPQNKFEKIKIIKKHRKNTKISKPFGVEHVFEEGIGVLRACFMLK